MRQVYNNKSLFSDYYLEERIAFDSHWQSHKKQSCEYRQRVTGIVNEAFPGIDHQTPEAEVERRLIRPVLDILEHVYFVQPGVLSSEGVRRPDYAFFDSVEALQEAETHKGQAEFFRTALAIGDAKAWERSLDKRLKGPGDPFTNHNPSYQVDFYLRATDKRWGLLTNGRHWRLYHRDLSYRLDVYYEVDLTEVVTLDEDAFLYFLAFFHREAFRPDGAGECFLDRAYRASSDYAARVSEELKDNVYEALRLLAEGFLAFPGNDLKPQDLGLVRENAFIVIYRLLFVLYAEAREFLPVPNPTYWGTYSLRALAHEIATKEPFVANLHPAATTYWSRLKELFGLINNGDDFLGIPPYNGRLFDDQKEHRCLATWQIGDRYLAGAIDQLARAEAAGRTGRGFVSYRDLSIRELGSIYEGLLEHRLRYAAEDMAVVKEDRREKLVPLAALDGRKALKVYPARSVYLETDKGERKATSSYYTPDYIVKYIIDNTLGPLLEEAKESGGELIETILSLKVLDPAMGSGHFLVEATDYLARALVEAMGEATQEVEEDDVRWARREVVERCIYGVDLNPLAVDLAKLSLWLCTVSLDKPLNFLDHHLRCGNSLIGAQTRDLGAPHGKALRMKRIGKREPEVRPSTIWEGWFIQSMATTVDHYFRIAAMSSDKIQNIRDKENLYDIARDILKRYYQVAHVWTSTHFGNEVDAQDYDHVLTSIRATEPEWAELEKKPWFADGVEIGKERRFFHWELEFPEAFFDRHGQELPEAGFSAVVGNPPYGSTLDSFEKQFCRTHLKSARRVIDNHALFTERGLTLTRYHGRLSFIVPSGWLTGVDYHSFREAILESGVPYVIVHLPYDVFPDAYVDTIVVGYCRGSGSVAMHVEHEVKVKRYGIREDASALASEAVQYEFVPLSSWRASPLLRFDTKAARPFARVRGKLVADSVSLGELVDVDRGVTPYREVSASHPSAAPGFRGEFDRYVVGSEESTWVQYDTTLSEYMPPRFTEGLRLVVRRIISRQFRLLVAAETRKLVFNKSYLVCLPGQKAYSPLFLCALANASLLSRWFVDLTEVAYRDDFPQIDIYTLKSMPVRRISFTTPKAERERLVTEADELYRRYLQSKDSGSILSFVSHLLPQKHDGTLDIEREQSHVVHDLLAVLAQEMTRLHKDSRAELGGFLTWLEDYLGVTLADLKNKTKVKEYYKAHVAWEGFIGAMEQNRRAIQRGKGVDITRREPQATVRSEFDTSVARLNPILEAIDLTDRLIDQIVYRLYGLSEAEIAIVEQR